MIRNSDNNPEECGTERLDQNNEAPLEVLRKLITQQIVQHGRLNLFDLSKSEISEVINKVGLINSVSQPMNLNCDDIRQIRNGVVHRLRDWNKTTILDQWPYAQSTYGMSVQVNPETYQIIRQASDLSHMEVCLAKNPNIKVEGYAGYDIGDYAIAASLKGTNRFAMNGLLNRGLLPSSLVSFCRDSTSGSKNIYWGKIADRSVAELINGAYIRGDLSYGALYVLNMSPTFKQGDLVNVTSSGYVPNSEISRNIFWKCEIKNILPPSSLFPLYELKCNGMDRLYAYADSVFDVRDELLGFGATTTEGIDALYLGSYNFNELRKVIPLQKYDPRKSFKQALKDFGKSDAEIYDSSVLGCGFNVRSGGVDNVNASYSSAMFPNMYFYTEPVSNLHFVFVRDIMKITLENPNSIDQQAHQTQPEIPETAGTTEAAFRIALQGATAEDHRNSSVGKFKVGDSGVITMSASQVRELFTCANSRTFVDISDYSIMPDKQFQEFIRKFVDEVYLDEVGVSTTELDEVQLPNDAFDRHKLSAYVCRCAAGSSKGVRAVWKIIKKGTRNIPSKSPRYNTAAYGIKLSFPELEYKPVFGLACVSEYGLATGRIMFWDTMLPALSSFVDQFDVDEIH